MNTYDAWYMRPEWFVEGMRGRLPDPTRLTETHVKVKSLAADNPERAFVEMQAERWSPNGEARETMRSHGLAHTSMSVGDVLVERLEGDHVKIWVVSSVGFKELRPC